MAAALMNNGQVYWIFGVYWILNIIIFILFSSIASALAFSTAASESVVVPKSRILLKGIDASQFRHPLDRDLTSFVRGVPLSFVAENAIRSALSFAEKVTRLDLLSSSVKVSPQQMPELHKAMEDASKLLDMSVTPELYVQSSGQANAFTLAFQNTEFKAPIVVVTSGLLDRCTNDEIEAIIGHELGHIKCSHSLYLTVGGLASAPLRALPIVGSQVEDLLQQWRLSAEYSCDRAALLVAQDVTVVAGAMLKLFAGTSRATNTDAFIEQAKEYERLLKESNPMIQASIRMQQRTHPLPVKRLAELEKWFNSDEYKSIIISSE
jgi:Zn-dependent protease with chaperone function